MTWNMFLLEHWKNSDYFILSIKASGWMAYCFQTLLKMEHIGKGWGLNLVGGYLCAQPFLPVLSLLSLCCYLIFMFSTSNITGKSIKYTKSKSRDNYLPKCVVQVSNKIHV